MIGVSEGVVLEKRKNVSINLLAFGALVEDSLSFISRSQLHSVELQLGVSTLRALFLHRGSIERVSFFLVSFAEPSLRCLDSTLSNYL